MFAVLFGLSMDYEVFLLSRVREEYLARRDTPSAVSAGLARTARVITAAALIMVAVFGAFALSSDVSLKLIGDSLAWRRMGTEAGFGTQSRRTVCSQTRTKARVGPSSARRGASQPTRSVRSPLSEPTLARRRRA